MAIHLLKEWNGGSGVMPGPTAAGMTTDGQSFLAQLSALPANTFENNFSQTSILLGLGSFLNRAELRLLYDAAFCATLCNIAFNGLGRFGGRIKTEQESNRWKVEHEFMAARERFYSCAGWLHLPRATRSSIQRAFFRVQVNPKNFAC